jgi:hypothetical protein
MYKFKLLVFLLLFGLCIVIPGGIIGIIILIKLDPTSFIFIKSKIPFLNSSIKMIEGSDIYKKGTEFIKEHTSHKK